ncbi:VOC family protein [Micromonospora luteifusca]|uniref:VOC family protein n=1 Tax=Micromonospora luteifusca TaxID=709860 RepID=UPI0033BBD8E9
MGVVAQRREHRQSGPGHAQRGGPQLRLEVGHHVTDTSSLFWNGSSFSKIRASTWRKEIDEAMALVVDLGGRFTGERHDYDEGVVVVMADPEDHEFCLVQYYR